MSFDNAEWKRRIADLLKEHPDIGSRVTGMIEINLNEGGITKIYLNRKVKTAAEASNYFDHLKEKVETLSVRINIG